MNISRLDLNLLKVFDAVYTHRNFTRAGEALDLSQPAVSRAIQRLRVCFDDVLFERSPFGVMPTPKAAAIAAYVQEALCSTQAALDFGREVDPRDLNVVFRLGTNDYLSLLLLPTLALRIRAKAANVRLIAPNVGHTSAETMLDGNAIDAAIVSERVLGSRYEFTPLFTEDYVCIVRHDHPRVPDSELDLDTFIALDHLLVSHASAERGWVDAVLENMGCSRRVAMSIPHFSVAPSIIASTDMICTLPSRIAHLLGHCNDVRVLRPPIPNRSHLFHLVWLRRYGASPIHKWFRQEIAEACQTLV